MLRLKLTLRALGAIGILGTVALVMAQQIASKETGGNGPQKATGSRSRAGGGAAIVNGRTYKRMESAHPGPWKFEAPTAAQHVLKSWIISETNRLIDLAKAQSQPERVQGIIEAQCYYILTTMRPDEQKHEMYDVWNVDVWQAGGKWDHVTSAPSLVNALAKIEAKQNATISAIWDKAREDHMRPYMELSRRITKEVGNDQVRHHQRYTEELRKLQGEKSKSDVATDRMTRLRPALNAVYGQLNAAQKREWDRILVNFNQDVLSAYRGEAVKLGVATK